MKKFAKLFLAALLLPMVLLASGCSGGDDKYITVYVGRSSVLIGPLLEQFARDTGIKIRVRYGDGTELALGILEEGKKSPADVYYGQDVGSLGALQAAGLLAPLPDDLLNRVLPGFRSTEKMWVGTSGRARVMVYNTDLDPKTLPTSALEYIDPKWKGKVGIVPLSDGFPEFITALRLTRGEDFAKNWLTAMKANNPKIYPNNLSALQSVANKEVEVAYLNHYYLYRFLAERGENFKARNYFFNNGDLGGLFVVSGAAVLKSSKKQELAHRFIQYLLEETSQQYLATKDFEYPLSAGVKAAPELPDVSTLNPPQMDLSKLGDLRGSLELMRQTGILP